MIKYDFPSFKIYVESLESFFTLKGLLSNDLLINSDEEITGLHDNHDTMEVSSCSFLLKHEEA